MKIIKNQLKNYLKKNQNNNNSDSNSPAPNFNDNSNQINNIPKNDN